MKPRARGSRPPKTASFGARLAFAWRIVVETIFRRRFARVLEARRGGAPLDVTGEAFVPPAGPFVLAVNHYFAGLTLDVVSATLLAAERSRPGLASECSVVIGHRMKPATSWRARIVRAFAHWFFGRWAAHVLRIRSSRGEAGVTSLAGLRQWRERARGAPTLVFPEGIAQRELGSIRDGAGTWLASLGVPVVPVAVWWDDTKWRVAFGAPIAWAARRDLRDVQLGLAIAALLPEPLAPKWSPLLARWRSAHAA